MEKCPEHSSLTDKVSDMHGDIKVLIAEFKAMNGCLISTKLNIEKHEEDSKHYRTQIDILWASLHTIKWAIGLLCAGGVLFRIISNLVK
jgi:hypothetical protein